MIVEFLHRHRHLYSIERMCRVLQEHEYSISPATYYRYLERGFGPTQAELDDAYAAHRLYKLWVKHKRVYGKVKLWEEAKRQGWGIGRDQIHRLMRILGIKGVSRRKKIRTTISDPAAERFTDHIKRAWKEAQRPDQWWVADFTYVPTACGFSYVSFVEDVYTRELLAFVVDDHPDRSLVIRALKQAVAHRRRQDPTFDTAGVIHHSDAGSQYTSHDLKALLEDYKMKGSIGTVGDAYDNGLMESAIGLYKTEVIDFDNICWLNSRHVEHATAEWFQWYNHQRLHSSIGYLPPVEYYNNYKNRHAATMAA